MKWKNIRAVYDVTLYVHDKQISYIFLQRYDYDVAEYYGRSITFLVSGCANMSPPEGAWMTRDGDVIEIGCHSGSKTWTLTCEHSKWIGVIGYCGQDSRQKKPNLKDGVIRNSETSVLSVSPSEYMDKLSTKPFGTYKNNMKTIVHYKVICGHSKLPCTFLDSDVLVFGVSSLIILCSACIFLAGVIVLKRYFFLHNQI